MNRLLALLIKGYQYFLSPFLGSACRFTPSCSRYAAEALLKHGTFKGAYLSIRRLLRCHPWCCGGHDPIP